MQQAPVQHNLNEYIQNPHAIEAALVANERTAAEDLLTVGNCMAVSLPISSTLYTASLCMLGQPVLATVVFVTHVAIPVGFAARAYGEGQKTARAECLATADRVLENRQAHVVPDGGLRRRHQAGQRAAFARMVTEDGTIVTTGTERARDAASAAIATAIIGSAFAICTGGVSEAVTTVAPSLLHTAPITAIPMFTAWPHIGKVMEARAIKGAYDAVAHLHAD